MMTRKEAGALVRETLRQWYQDETAQWAAALSYYTLFSIVPLLILVTSVAGLIFGDEAAKGRVVDELQVIIGRPSAQAMEQILSAVQWREAGWWAVPAAVVALMFAATRAFGVLHCALNSIWSKKPSREGLVTAIKRRLLSFALVLSVGLLLLVSILTNAALSGIGRQVGPLIPGLQLLQVGNTLVSFGAVVILFALIYKTLPEVKIAWSDVWVGALVTALLFGVGQYLISMYFRHTRFETAYGAAGSVILLLFWLYLSAHVALFGAEFTEVYARRHGSRRTAPV